jgi:hypothetical protein
MSLTFNPHRFETPYGIGLLDDVHNILPEILYDTAMFPRNQLVTFVQTRVRTLFEEEYIRNRTQYRLFQQSRRSSLPPPPPPPPLQPLQQPLQQHQVPIVTATTTVTTTSEEEDNIISSFLELFGTLATTGQATHRSPRESQQGSRRFVRRGQGLQPRPNPQGFMDPVPVHPTSADLERATILSSIEPPAEEICTICQSHNVPPSSPQWRIIRHCGHRFHRSCIDQWFETHVRCPNCQHDIRDYADRERDAVDN